MPLVGELVVGDVRLTWRGQRSPQAGDRTSSGDRDGDHEAPHANGHCPEADSKGPRRGVPAPTSDLAAVCRCPPGANGDPLGQLPPPLTGDAGKQDGARDRHED